MHCIDCNVLLVETGDEANRYLSTDRCITCALQFRYCPNCGLMLLRRDMRNDSCRPCFRENPSLAGYCTRVDCTNLEHGKRLFGVELETELRHPSEANMKAMLIEIDDLLGESVIMKHDGSLSNGIEIVTKPFTREKQYITWDKFLTNRPKGLRSWDSPNCGMHVHVSREGLVEETIARAVCFCNSQGNKKFVYVMSGRKDNTYAKYKAKDMSNAAMARDRHEAINLCNDTTIEFRMFKGTLKKESVFKNIEFCDAILEFAAQPEISLSQAMSRASFVRFVKHHEDKWPHLMSFIMCRWFGKATELSSKIGWKPFKNCSAKNEMSITFEE